MSDDVEKFIILYLECFIIIFFMGGVLPNILEQVLNYLYNKPNSYQNSILVGVQINRPLEIICRYKYIFSLLIR
jgi:hypothetical protein